MSVGIEGKQVTRAEQIRAIFATVEFYMRVRVSAPEVLMDRDNFESGISETRRIPDLQEGLLV